MTHAQAEGRQPATNRFGRIQRRALQCRMRQTPDNTNRQQRCTGDKASGRRFPRHRFCRRFHKPVDSADRMRGCSRLAENHSPAFGGRPVPVPRRSPARRRLRLGFRKEIAEHHGMIAFGIAGAVHQRHGSATQGLPQRAERLRLLPQTLLARRRIQRNDVGPPAAFLRAPCPIHWPGNASAPRAGTSGTARARGPPHRASVFPRGGRRRPGSDPRHRRVHDRRGTRARRAGISRPDKAPRAPGWPVANPAPAPTAPATSAC